MSVIERPFRSMTKNADNAPALGIALPVRKRSPVEFWMCVYQMLPPLNTKMGFMIQKADERNVKDGKLPAAARNALLERALSRDMQYVFFLDDDVIFPDITLYRLWVMMQKHPEIACTTAVGTTKLNPPEPLMYQEGVQGAWWDWQLGGVTPIHSAWAGCMLVNLEYVKKLKEPWFNDVVTSDGSDPGERVKQNVWGHDRYFHKRLREEAGGVVMADTGLLVGHFDADTQRTFIVPPDAPCFNKPVLGDAFVPYFDDEGLVAWRYIVTPNRPDTTFLDYLKWLESQTPQVEKPVISILGTETPKEGTIEPKVGIEEQRDGYVVKDSRRSDAFAAWFENVGA